MPEKPSLGRLSSVPSPPWSLMQASSGPLDATATRVLTWAATPGLADAFGALVRELSARHVGPPD